MADGAADLASAGADGGNLACPLPALLVAVAGGGGPGQVLRVSLGAGGPPSSCAPLIDANHLPSGLRTVAWIKPSSVAVAADSDVLLLDADHDGERWHYAIPNTVSLGAIDSFALTTAAETFTGVAYHAGSPTIKQIDRIELYRDSSGPAYSFRLSSAPSVPFVFGVTGSPLAPSHLLALQAGTTPAAATEVDLLQQSTAPYVSSYPMGAVLLSLSSIAVGGASRTVWVDQTSNGVYFATGSGAGVPAMQGPVSCSLQCTLIHAVPDPTDPSGVLALCDALPGELRRSVVRFSTVAAGCAKILDFATLDPSLTPNRMALALP